MHSVYNKNMMLKSVYKFWVNYLSPTNFSYWWNFGSMAFICLFLQMVTGVFLAMHYKSDLNLAFVSIEYIMSEVQYGWLISYMHSNGASVFFIVVYLHMMRGFLFGSFLYPSQLLWVSGVVIFLLMIATAFFGYVLPWGQMSFWASTVIISLFSVMPYFGDMLMYWILGGFSVDDATLNSFYSLHFFLPFIMLAMTMLHLMLLHEYGSNNSLGMNFKVDGLPMSPYYIVKDIFGLNMIFIFFFLFVFLYPNYLGHSDNYILSNPLITPHHIVPEWYFLPLYAVLSSVPNKSFGVVILLFAMLLILFTPLVFSMAIISSIYFKPFLKSFMLLFFITCSILGWMGGQPVIQPYYFMGQVVTFVYFCLFFCFIFFSFFENKVFEFFVKKF